MGKSNIESDTIIHDVKSFSSFIACYLVRLDEQFFWALSKYFFRAKIVQPPRNIGRYTCKGEEGVYPVWCRGRRAKKKVILYREGAPTRESDGGPDCCFTFTPLSSRLLSKLYKGLTLSLGQMSRDHTVDWVEVKGQ